MIFLDTEVGKFSLRHHADHEIILTFPSRLTLYDARRTDRLLGKLLGWHPIIGINLEHTVFLDHAIGAVIKRVQTHAEAFGCVLYILDSFSGDWRNRLLRSALQEHFTIGRPTHLLLPIVDFQPSPRVRRQRAQHVA